MAAKLLRSIAGKPCLLIVAASALSLPAQPVPDPTASFGPADLAHGKKLFIVHCGPCHGVDGGGGRGPNLAVPKLKRAADNAGVFDIAQNGIEGTSMDGAWQLSDAELWRVVAYVRTLGRGSAATLPGDPEQGRRVFAKYGCAACHIIAGEGGSLGPELTSIGAQRSGPYIEESILKPGANVPPEFAMVRIRSNSGEELRAIRLNEDSFTIQVKDLNGRFHSYRKSDLAECAVLTGESAMPAYAGRISPSELTDLVAYLASLRGRP